MRSASVSERAKAAVERVRASSMRPRCAAMNTRETRPAASERPSWVIRSTDSDAYRSASSQLPARHSRWDMYQSAPSSRMGSFRTRATRQHLVVERTRPVDVRRPDELVPEVEGRAVVERPAWQRPLEEDSVFHLRACDATSGVEVHLARRPRARQRSATSSTREAARRRGGRIHALLDPALQPMALVSPR